MAEPAQPATVLRVRSLSPHVKELVLAPRHPVAFKPGQWISLQLPVGNRPPLVRAYSMAEPKSDSGHLVLAFDRVPGGIGSEYLFGLNENDEVHLSGPYGRFVLPEPAPGNLVLIARYTGIVPIRCLLRHLCSKPPSGNLILSYSAPNEDELIYHSEFKEAASHENFHYLPWIAGKDAGLDEPVQNWPLLRDLAPHIAAPTDVFLMISGIKAFVRPLRAYFADLGWDRSHIRTETFD